MNARQNFLSRLIEPSAKEPNLRAVNFDCVLFYLKTGLRGYTSQKAKVIKLCESCCMVTCPVPDAVQDHLYLVIDGIPAKFSCAVVKRLDEGLRLRFSKDLPTPLIEKLTTRVFN
jgi:hypothetical protein